MPKKKPRAMIGKVPVWCAHDKIVDCVELKPNPKNPNTHPASQIALLGKIITEQGWRSPITVSKRSGLIVKGHGRLEAAFKAGIQKAPVDLQDYESEAAEHADMVADNRLAELAALDNDKLQALMAELSDFDIDMALTGFTDADIKKLMPENGLVDAEPQIDKAAELNKVWKVKTGDLYQIGDHWLLCGDSTKVEDVERLMGGEKADMVFTDPPYSSGGSQESGKVSGSIGARGGKKIKGDNLSTRGYVLLMADVLSLANSAHSIFIFCDWKMWIETFDISERAGFRVRNMIVWDKMQMGMGMPFRNQHELCLFGSKIAGKIGNGNTPNVLQHKRDRESEHATPKPSGLIADMLKQIGSENVYDPFIGSGSTMVACQNLNRKCRGIEISESYCAVILQRMTDAFPDIEIKKIER